MAKLCEYCQVNPARKGQKYCSNECNQHAYQARKAADVVADPESPDQWAERAGAYLAEHHPLPPVPAIIQATRREDMGFDTEQEGFALFSDLHLGSKIDPRITAGMARYDTARAVERLTRWRDGLLRFTQMDQYLIPLKTLNLAALGDDLEGHGAMFETQKFQMTDSIGFQAMSFIDHMSSVILDLLSRYKHINVYKVRGNHGRISATAKGDYPPDNIELVAWQAIADRVRAQTGGDWSLSRNGIRLLRGGLVDFSISPAFMMTLSVMGYNVALRHGDGVGPVARTYTGLVDNKLRLNAIVGRMINYYFIAHHHEPQSVEHEIGGEAIVNGCFVGPSQLSVSMSRPAANIPSQEFFLFHPKHGLTHRHRIRLASAEEMRADIEWLGEDE